MLSKRYIYKSNQLRDRYADGAIDYEKYISSLETAQNEELQVSHYISEASKKQKEQIYLFEIEQFYSARQMIIKKGEAAKHKKLFEEEQIRIKTLTPEQKLYAEREKYYNKEVPKLINEYQSESRRYRNAHNGLQWIVIIGSAVVTSTTGITIFTNLVTVSYIFKSLAAVCSLIVTIAAGFMGYFKYRERSTNLQKAADDIENEYEAIRLGTQIYLGEPREKAMGIFSDRVLKRIREHKEEQQILEQPSDVKQPQNQKRS